MAAKTKDTSFILVGKETALYVFSSNMFRLAMEINGMKSKRPMLQVLYDIGWVDKRYKSTQANRKMVLQALVEKRAEIFTDAGKPVPPVPPTVQKALDHE